MTIAPQNPYSSLPPQAYWRTGVAEAGIFGLSGLWKSKWVLPGDARFSTFGSCFAQHISRALQARGMNWVDGEPAPGRIPAELAKAFNYGVFSARTANIYTAAQLVTLLRMVTGQTAPDSAEVWQDADGWRDSLRPAIEPKPFASRAEALLSRQSMLRGLRLAVTGADVFVFTLGLTEGWESAETGQPYATCPGTVGGTFNPDQHRFVNYRAAAIRAALDEALALMRGLNPDIHLLLTVSPVPLTATASGDHVLVATMHSKSVLRGVAGELAQDDPRVDYFPSYEIINGPPTRSAFFEPNLRSVVPQGVDLVMTHFFSGLNTTGPARHGPADPDIAARIEAQMNAEELVCEEMMLEKFNAS